MATSTEPILSVRSAGLCGSRKKAAVAERKPLRVGSITSCPELWYQARNSWRSVDIPVAPKWASQSWLRAAFRRPGRRSYVKSFEIDWSATDIPELITFWLRRTDVAGISGLRKVSAQFVNLSRAYEMSTI